jgi:hypothetical protein
MVDDLSTDERYRQLEPDVREAIDQLVLTRDSPGFTVLLRYCDEEARTAMDELSAADPLDSAEIMRLQNRVKRFHWYAEAPDELIRGQLAREIADEREAESYPDD